MTYIEEGLPSDPCAAEAIAHVRRHLKHAIRSRSATVADLAILFGLKQQELAAVDLSGALAAEEPLQTAAAIIGKARRTKVIPLGWDAHHLSQCRAWLEERRRAEPAFDPIIASDLRTLCALCIARDAVVTDSHVGEEPGPLPILIQGETGTGKELLARAIHQIALRERKASGQFQAVQVSGLPSDLINDELFGHVQGAYTGANKPRKGRLEAAMNGTLLIDEVGDLPAEAQVRLLRFLQDRKLSRTGQNEELFVPVRVIAATWHDLEKDTTANRFRRDLLHRLRGVVIELPPLRERDDATTHVVPEILRQLRHPAVPPISRRALDALANWPWPGNLRELNVAIRTAIISAQAQTIRVEDLSSAIQQAYYRLPIDLRAPGILCDRYDDQPVTAIALHSRLDAVRSEIDAAPQLERIPGASESLAFLQRIPDNSDEHRVFVSGLENYVDTAKEFIRLEAVRATWERIHTRSLTPEAQAEVAVAMDEAAQRATAQHAVVEAARARVDLKSNAWIRLAGELEALPVLSALEPGQVLPILVGGLQALASIAPGALKILKKRVTKGGLPAVGRELLKLVEQSGGETDSHYRTWDRARWTEIMSDHASKAEAGRRLKLDTKTISACLTKVGIKRQRWGSPLPKRTQGRPRSGKKPSR